MNKKLALASFAALLFAAPTAQADDFVSMAPLARDFVVGSEGGEAAVPYFKFGDANLDGNPDMTFFFNVYTANTNTRLLNTPPKRVEAPTLPCTNPDLNSIEKDWSVKFLGGASGGTRIAALIQFELGCWDNDGMTWRDAYRTFIYSTDASVALSPATWTKTYNNATIGFDGNIDWDADGTGEFMLSLEVPTVDKARIVFIHPVSGEVESDKAYPVSFGDL